MTGVVLRGQEQSPDLCRLAGHGSPALTRQVHGRPALSWPKSLIGPAAVRPTLQHEPRAQHEPAFVNCVQPYRLGEMGK